MQHRPKMVVVLKGYPRLSETFIAQELLGLEQAGFDLVLVALRRPGDGLRHPVHDEIRAPVLYLPEYLHEEPWRVIRSAAAALRRRGFLRAMGAFAADLLRDPTRNRMRRLGQALVLAAEWPRGAKWLHAHFIHTPASVAAYASLILNVPWTCSAHAKDIWTTRETELAGKIRSARWVVTCTLAGFRQLSRLGAGRGSVHLSYHGLDLGRFGSFAGKRPARNGSDAADPVTILSVGRAVPKKGYDTLLNALALIGEGLSFRFVHVGGGEKLDSLKAQARELKLESRIDWLGPLSQTDVLDLYRKSDIFALACRIAGDGDRDGLPNVIVEASSQRLPCVSTNVSGVPELVSDGVNGLLVPPDDAPALAAALTRLILEPALRNRLGREAEKRVRGQFDHHAGIAQLVSLFEAEWRKVP